MLVSAAWFDQHVGSRVLSSARSDSVEVRIVRADGAELVAAAATDRGSDANAGAAPARTFERTVEIDGLALRLEARPRDVAALAAERSRRQTFYLSLLGVVALVMASGAWFTVRAVRHELAVAQLKADFVAAVSHEFRSPLTGIRQLGELLMRGRVPSDERRQEYYTRITRESDRLTRMVEHLLDFARMESGRREYRLAPVDVGPWLRDVAAAFQAQCPDGVPEIRVSIPDDLPVISADKDALACAVQNLLDNAAKYSPGRPTIWLDAAHGADGLTIRVRDEGEGIGEEDRARIFETFYRGSNTRARHVAGAGIGLGLVQHIVSAHGGRVTCESRPGDGTAFTIHLPAPKSATVPSPAWSARPSARADSAGG
jgi:signal transduction histidine kinase